MKLTVFGDLHYSENYKQVEGFEEKREEYFDYFLSQFFSQTADYYISIGDLTNTGTTEELRGIYQLINKHQSGKKFIHTIGNHDAYSQKKEQIVQQIAQDRYFVLTEGEICLIVLDSAREMDLADWSGFIDEQQLAWLEQVLADNHDKFIIICSHHPVYDTTLYSTAEKGSIVKEIPIDQVLNKHTGKGLLICGHTHADSFVQKGNWAYYQISSVMDQPVIRNIEVNTHEIEITSVEIEEQYKQMGIWLGARMNYFNLCGRGYQGMENREIHIKFD